MGQTQIEDGIKIKGTSDGWCIIIDQHMYISRVIEFVSEWQDEHADFFVDSEIEFCLLGKRLDKKEKKEIAKCLFDLFNVKSIHFGEKNKMNQLSTIQPTKEDEENEYVIVEKVVRSGERIESDGHLIVIGNVNPGAELVASGDIIVWGELKGLAHAGKKYKNSIIIAKKMLPIQLRIGHEIAIPPQEERQPTEPEIAYLEGKQLVVSAF